MRGPSVSSAVIVSACIAASCSSSTGSGGNPAGGDDAGAANDGSNGGGNDSGGGSGGDGSSGGSCLGSSLLGALGKDHLLVGATMADATAALAPFDLRYNYISGALFDGTSPCASCATGCTAQGKSCANAAGGCGWWGCWQYDQDPPGAYVRGFAATTAQASPPQIPMLTYYVILPASGVAEGSAEITQAANDAAFMTRYFADW